MTTSKYDSMDVITGKSNDQARSSLQNQATSQAIRGAKSLTSNLCCWDVRTELPVHFIIKSSPGILERGNKDLLEVGSQGTDARRVVVVDENVYSLFGAKIEEYFRHHKVDYKIVVIECSESRKDWDTLNIVLESMEEFGLLRRNEPVIAIGGGVLLDIVGMAASLYRRGVPYIKVPTTLLALVDASVGAKVAVNNFGRRNRLGAYYPAVATYLDTSFLITLSEYEMSNGMAEILKMAVIKDTRLFELLEEDGEKLIANRFQDTSLSIEIVNRSIQGMIEELQPNLWEKDLKRIVDFGHSFSPLIEMKALPELSHGEAVALDILFSCIISNQRGMLMTRDLHRIYATTKSLGLRIFHPMFANVELLEEGLRDTVRHRNGAQNLPIPKSIGHSIFVNDLSKEEIIRAAETMRQFASSEVRTLSYTCKSE